MTTERLIRKYADRRLYDVAASKHINKDGVRELIAAGENVRVVDDASGDDITRTLLMQLVSEQELGGQPVLSNEMLTHIIRFYGHPMQSMLAEYLRNSFGAFVDQQQSMQTQMQEMLSQGPMGSLSEMAQKSMENWMKMQQAFFTPPGRDDDSRDD